MTAASSIALARLQEQGAVARHAPAGHATPHASAHDLAARAGGIHAALSAAEDRATLTVVEDGIDTLLRDVARLHGPGHALQPMLEEWRVQARRRLRDDSAAIGFVDAPPEWRPSDVGAIPRQGGWRGYLGHHGRSFAFASAFMPGEERSRIAGVYAWCRYTDDLVDVGPLDRAEERLDAWLELSRAAYDGEVTGVTLLDEIMPAARDAGVPFAYPAELVAGMRMDLRHRDYASMAELRLYTWRAAGTVGLWLAEMYGVRDEWALERAALLGQAMQLTNIIRDVGEDLDRGRVYLPLDRLHAHGLSVRALHAARRARRTPGAGWASLIEELIEVAEREYATARAALHVLPASFRRAAAVASHVYAGIHDAVRRLDYDTLSARASTTAPEKLVLALRALRAT